MKIIQVLGLSSSTCSQNRESMGIRGVRETGRRGQGDKSPGAMDRGAGQRNVIVAANVAQGR